MHWKFCYLLIDFTNEFFMSVFINSWITFKSMGNDEIKREREREKETELDIFLVIPPTVQ